VVDVTDPARPRIAASCEAVPAGDGGQWAPICVSGKYAYLGRTGKKLKPDERGLYIVALGEPKKPRLVGRLADLNGIVRISVHGKYAYVSQYGPTYVADISVPRHPKVVQSGIVGRYYPIWRHAVDASRGLLYRGVLQALEVWKVPVDERGQRGP